MTTMLTDIKKETFRTYGVSNLDLTREYKNLTFYFKGVTDYFKKPLSGLWASPSDTRHFSTWEEFCREEYFKVETLRKFVEFRFKDSAKILCINTVQDFKKVRHDYPSKCKGIDWDEVAKDYDAVWFYDSNMPWEEINRLKLNNTWDVDSICVFNLNAIELTGKRR